MLFSLVVQKENKVHVLLTIVPSFACFVLVNFLKINPNKVHENHWVPYTYIQELLLERC